MIIQIWVEIQKIILFGKKYPWEKPEKCPVCGSLRLWGHGYVFRYFEYFIEGLWLKRYRCPECGAVHTMKPDLFWPRFHYSVSTVLGSVYNKITNNRWVKCIARQNQQYWYRGLKKQIAVYYPAIKNPTLKLIKTLISKEIIPASHSLYQGTLRL